MTRMMKLVGIALVAAILAALAGILVAGDLSTALAQANTPATGAPVIEGAAQLHEILLARTSWHISDADGMTNPVFRFQWISNDGTTDADIDGATSRTYTIVAADLGKTIKVRVSFTDDAGNPEMLTSTPTGVVLGQRNSPPTGLPTIGGTPQVGQKLTVNTSGITDADGLTNVSYGASWYAGEGYLRGQIGQGYDLSYTVSRRDVGMTLDVTVNFKDDAGKYASLTSAPTAVVAATSPAAPGNFAVSPNAAGDPELSWEEPMWDLGGEILGRKTWGDGGSPITGYVVQWKEDADSLGHSGGRFRSNCDRNVSYHRGPYRRGGLYNQGHRCQQRRARHSVGRSYRNDQPSGGLDGRHTERPDAQPASTSARSRRDYLIHRAGGQQRIADNRYAYG